jgi:ubiquinone/menaquinone biosynthesis C-methylase UbiE
MSVAPTTDAIRDGYDKWSVVYDHDQNPLPALEEPLVHDLIAAAAPKGRAVLDLGCGTGRHALHLAREGAEVTACDFSPGMLSQARAKSRDAVVRFLEVDLERPLPFREAEFDVIVSGLVLEHIASPAALFGEIFRILRPEGQAILSTMHPAMFLRGSQARFTDPDTETIVAPGSHPHSTSDFVMAGLGAGLRLFHLTEHSPPADLATRFPRCEKYVGYPMLLLLGFDR